MNIKVLEPLKCPKVRKCQKVHFQAERVKSPALMLVILQMGRGILHILYPSFKFMSVKAFTI